MFVRSIYTVSISKLFISDVFHVSKLSYNLLSVGQLVELGYRIILDYFGCVVQDPRTGQELGTGHKIVTKAIVRNPLLLTYDFHNIFKLAIALYDEMGVSGQDLIPMLLSWPTMIPRTSFDEEKMEYPQNRDFQGVQDV